MGTCPEAGGCVAGRARLRLSLTCWWRRCGFATIGRLRGDNTIGTVPATTGQPPGRWPFLAPFATRSFRFQWPADLCTAWALEMETLILGWYVLVESGSVVLLTVFGALQFVGTLVSPVLGVLGDRLGLRNVLAGMRVCYAVFASLILFLALTRQISPTLVLMVAAMSGLVRPTDIGMRSALVGATVPPVKTPM